HHHCHPALWLLTVRGLLCFWAARRSDPHVLPHSVYPYLYHDPHSHHHGAHAHRLLPYHRHRHCRAPDPHYHLHLDGNGAPTCLSLLPHPPRSTVSPSTTLFRSHHHRHPALWLLTVRGLLCFWAARRSDPHVLPHSVYPYLYHDPHS